VCARAASSGTSPDWDRLFETAAAQAGYVSLRQATAAGYSRQLTQHYVREGRLERIARGLFRLVHFPSTEHEELVPVWLWSEQEGVFSHETALMLHDLSDALPAKQHLTLPSSWKKRRVRPPRGVILHFADLAKESITWFGAVPVTTPLQTIFDCVTDAAPEDFVRQATRQGLRRGLFEKGEVQRVLRKARKGST